MAQTGIIEGPKHEQGGIGIEVEETGEHKEVEGGEYFLCSDALFSDKVHSFDGQTARQILDALFSEYQCRTFSPNVSAKDFIVCALAVENPTPIAIKGTVKEILNVLQAQYGCYVMGRQEYTTCKRCEHEPDCYAKGGPLDKELQEQIDHAYKRGSEFFKMGGSSSAIQDPVVMEMIKYRKTGEGSDKILKAWADGYTSEKLKKLKAHTISNLSEPVILKEYPIPTKAQVQSIYNETIRIMEGGGPKTPAEIRTVELYEGRGSMVGTGKIDEGLLHQFYTPYIITKKMYDLAAHYGFSGTGNILEPSCGSGRFFKFAPPNAKLIGFDLDEMNINIVKALYPNVTTYKQEFETAFLAPPMFTKALKKSWLPEIDLVIGNPPYGDYAGYYKTYMPKGYSRFEFLFIRLGLQVLKPGGLLVFIISQNFMNNGGMYAAMKKDILNIGTFVDAIRMPNGIFASTEVGTDIVIFKRK